MSKSNPDSRQITEYEILMLRRLKDINLSEFEQKMVDTLCAWVQRYGGETKITNKQGKLLKGFYAKWQIVNDWTIDEKIIKCPNCDTLMNAIGDEIVKGE